jgi:hypothetical protein
MTYISLYILESKSLWFLEVSNFNISIFSVREILKNSTRVIWQINQTTTGPSFRELRQILTDMFSVSSRHCRVYNLASCNSSTVFFVAYFHCSQFLEVSNFNLALDLKFHKRVCTFYYFIFNLHAYIVDNAVYCDIFLILASGLNLNQVQLSTI